MRILLFLILTIIIKTTHSLSLAIDAEFMCLSIEWNHLPEAFLIYAQGKPTGQINPFSINLIRNLAAGVRYQGSPTLRIGGNSATLMWWSRSNVTRPPTTNLTVAPITLGLMDRIATATNSRLVPDISMLLPDPAVTTDFVKTGLLANINYRNLLAIELGNEPEIWVRKGFRPENWTYTSDYINEFITFTNKITNDIPTIPKTYFWGPAMSTMGNLTTFIASNQPSINGFSFHRYALSGCTDDPKLVNLPLLLQDPYPTSYNFLFNAVNAATTISGVGLNGKNLVAGEINSVSCGGVDGVSNVFGAAIWGLDNFLTLADLSIRKVCVHGAQGNFRSTAASDHSYGPWISDLHENVVNVRPIYYSMLFFNRIIGSANSTVRQANFTILDPTALPPQPVDASTTPTPPNIKLWLVKNGNGGYTFVILHKDLGLPAVDLLINATSLQVSGDNAAMVERMTAANVYSKTGIRVAGMTLDGSTDGRPVGKWQTEIVRANSADELYRITVDTGTVAVMYLAGAGPGGPVGATSFSARSSSCDSILVTMLLFICWMAL
ncbi:hypothetical protein SeMB42_g03866 [Synchytrium endobioticum]|uniref:Beta-glucuronidase n=1 Tax=Synchytrium endobioticum TaxID=286115 RepID=A0A507D306_9FUNG|nr:hypothetical protein SeMB42_g03866 [Synchytrium endobioticum]TPX47982.1 hypothetical protein SeLEV6574_g02313 [Synchytrium endobioticum]